MSQRVDMILTLPLFILLIDEFIKLLVIMQKFKLYCKKFM